MRREQPQTAADVLRCDRCKAPVDDTSMAMVFWWPADYGVPVPPVSLLVLGHKRCLRHSEGEYSIELDWLKPERALSELARMTNCYAFTAAQLERLILIVWALAALEEPAEPHPGQARARGEGGEQP